jgi:ubiquinone/menaquinone biosynthesis C-methylase UbiE
MTAPVMVCPRCSARLENLQRCDACGLAFADEQGVPALISPPQVLVDGTTYDPARHARQRQRLRQLMREPPLAPASEPLPYHMDRAHAASLLRVAAGASMLEIGCGGGQVREFARSRDLTYFGVDASLTRVHDWLQRYGGPDALCDAHRLPFPEATFDVVYSTAVFEHLAAPHRAAREVFRVLRRGGLFLGSTAFLQPWHDDSYFHMTPLGVLEMLDQAGLSVECMWPSRGYSGFHALAEMTGRFTRLLRPLASTLYGAYRFERRLADAVRRRSPDDAERFMRRATVAGAVDWIAIRP